MAQLFTMLGKDFSVVGLQSRIHRPKHIAAGSFPVARWPNGRFCLPVALYLERKLLAGLKCHPNGGSLKTYICDLSPLIRYCFDNRQGDFLTLSDYDFSACVEDVLEEERLDDFGAPVKRRNRTTVRRMSSLWLDFLDEYSKWSAVPNFIGEDGVIKAKMVVIKGPFGPLNALVHSSSPPADPYNFHHPMSMATLGRLREAAALRSKGAFERSRRLIMLELFEVLGFRRIEAALLRVKDVQPSIDAMLEARAQALGQTQSSSRSRPVMRHRQSFALTFRVRKNRRGREKLRTTPVSAVTLQRLKEYLEERDVEISLLGTQVCEEGNFFINMSTGNAYMPNFFTQEFSHLGELAGISDLRCSPHPVRGRFFVNELLRLAAAHFEAHPPGDPARYVIDFNDFVVQLQEISGHTTTEALKVYIKFAQDEFAEISKSLKRVDELRTLSAVQRAREEFDWEILQGASYEAAAKRLRAALEVIDLFPEQPMNQTTVGSFRHQ